MKTKFKYKLEEFDKSELQDHERLAARHREKYQSVLRKLREKVQAPITNNVGVEPIGNEEFVPIVKKEYGFDWEKRKSLHSEDYQPE